MPDATTIDYVVDSADRRIGKKVNGALTQGFLYKDQLNPIAELDGDNNIVSRFIYGDKAHLPSYMVKGGVTYRVVSDHLGSVRLVVNVNTGEVAQKLEYDSFGRVLSDSNPGFQPFGFAGGIYDTDTGFVKFGARDYDPTTGRWTTKDPIGLSGGLNLYTYVLNNPVNSVDPDGRNAIRVAAAVIAATAKYGKQAIKKGKEVWGDLNFDGPSPGLEYGNGRVCQIRFKKQPVFRMDYQPIPGSNNESRLHVHVPPNLNHHFSIDPRSFGD